jgi:hypothetical protein
VAQAVVNALFAAAESDALFLSQAESEITGAAVARSAEVIANAARLAESEGDCKMCDRNARRGLLLDREDDAPGSVTPRWELTAWGLSGLMPQSPGRPTARWLPLQLRPERRRRCRVRRSRP